MSATTRELLTVNNLLHSAQVQGDEKAATKLNND